MKSRKVIVITSTGDISEPVREFFSRRYVDMELIIVSTDDDGEINLSKVTREVGKGEFVTTKGVLSQSQLEEMVKNHWIIAEWLLDSVSGKPMYECVHRKQ